MMGMTKCRTGKKQYDKKSAQTLKNESRKYHHIEMGIYQCNSCDWWHLTTIKDNKKGKFNHNLNLYEKRNSDHNKQAYL